jgi:hypothetical protein
VVGGAPIPDHDHHCETVQVRKSVESAEDSVALDQWLDGLTQNKSEREVEESAHDSIEKGEREILIEHEGEDD